MNGEGKMYLVLALHNHQPVGNLSQVFEEAFAQAYQPFIDVVERFDGIKVVLHYTGSLLEWLESNRPDFIQRLRRLVEQGRAEIMSGAYYEPILPIIPDADKKGQIRLLSSRVSELFGSRPQGMWLAERIWEPHLVRPIFEAGLRYVTVDDSHFHLVGRKNLFHYYRTEEEGLPLDIFPISEELRYRIPFEEPGKVIEFLRKQCREGESRLLVLADDGEKFGSWPGTYRPVYEEGWLEEFFTLVQESSCWLRTVTFSEYRRMFRPHGPVYLPAASYREMGEWSGGYWRNFLARYPESNRMHKKMLAVRRRLEELPSGQAYREARRHLWAAQCNCAYWHGIFGGLYLNFLRASVWENLLKAEGIILEALHRGPFLELFVADCNYDGRREIIINTDRLALLLEPHRGGCLSEFSWRPAAVNVLDTLTRRPEAYHRRLLEQQAESNGQEDSKRAVSIHERIAVKEKDLAAYLHYDPYPRLALIEHFFDDATALEEFGRGCYREAANFLMQPMTAALGRLRGDSGSPGGVRVLMRRRGRVCGEGEVATGVLSLEKALTVQPGQDTVLVEYVLHNHAAGSLRLLFGVELNLAFLAGRADDRYYRLPDRELAEKHLASTGAEENVRRFSIYDRWRDLALHLHFSRAAEVWRLPVETVSLSEGGMERAYQQSLVLPRWRVEVPAGESRTVKMKLSFSRAAGEGEQTE